MAPLIWFILLRFASINYDFGTNSNPSDHFQTVVDNASTPIGSVNVFSSTYLDTRHRNSHFSPTIRAINSTRVTCIFACLLTAQAGDIQVNPGPTCKFPCGICKKAVKHKDRGFGCDHCYVWYHASCIDMNSIVYQCLQNEPDDLSWICDKCGIPNFSTSFFDGSSSLSISDLSTSNNFSILSKDSPGPPLASSSPCDRPKTQTKPKDKTKGKIIPNLPSIVVNCRSIVKNKAPFKNLIESTKPDIVIGTESWLTPDIQSSKIFPEGYSVYRKDRKSDKKRGGGVFLMVSAKYISIQLTELDTDCEVVWAQVQLPGLK